VSPVSIDKRTKFNEILFIHNYSGVFLNGFVLNIFIQEIALCEWNIHCIFFL
jgi:hypothetical protein